MSDYQGPVRCFSCKRALARVHAKFARELAAVDRGEPCDPRVLGRRGVVGCALPHSLEEVAAMNPVQQAFVRAEIDCPKCRLLLIVQSADPPPPTRQATGYSETVPRPVLAPPGLLMRAI